MVKRTPKPDTRPKWYSDLKVYFSGRYYSAEEYCLLCERYLSMDRNPHYTVDKTYNLRVKRENKS